VICGEMTGNDKSTNCAFGQAWPVLSRDMERWGVKLGLVWRTQRERKPGRSGRTRARRKEKRKKREGRKKMLKPRGKTEAGGDRSVGGTQAGDAGGAGAVQVRW